MIKMITEKALGSLFAVFFLCSLTAIMHAATIAKVSTDDLVNKAELIFEGKVVAVRSKMNQRGYIYTYIKFDVVDVLIGEWSKNTLELRFTGGTVGNVRLNVGSIMPSLGQRGIYFVEKVEQGLVNPLLGWEQGRFTIADDGSVIAGNTQPVRAVERRSDLEFSKISNGVAEGIVTTQSAQSSAVQSRALTVEEFKRKISDMKR